MQNCPTAEISLTQASNSQSGSRSDVEMKTYGAILEGRSLFDEAIDNEVTHSRNDTKLRFGKTKWLTVLAEMKRHKILMPSGVSKRTTSGLLSLPGLE